MDDFFMDKALKLAEEGKGWTSPNPMVGAVIVRDGTIVGEGYHRYYGGAHAEVNAINMAGKLAKDSTMYVSLEPCSHHGKTPPCTEAILRAGISKLVVAIKDPNPLVAGKGLAFLEKNGVDLVVGVLADRAQRLNEKFIKHVTSKIPFVAVKVASTLDGRIATRSGSSKWITGSAAREFSHLLRHEYDAILVGINTVLTDNPSLDCRITNKKVKDPIRVLLDSKLRIPLDSKLISSSATASLIVFTSSGDDDKVRRLNELGVEVIRTTGKARPKPGYVLEQLSARGIGSLLIEGGGEVIWSFFESDLVDKLYLMMAPKLVGGVNAFPVTAGEGIEDINAAIDLKWGNVKMLGNDLLITCYRELT